MPDIQTLKRCTLFAGLNDAETARLAEICTLRKAAAHQQLFTEGDPAAGFFVLMSGSVRIFRSSPDGQEYTLHRIRPGQLFAEAAIFGKGTYPASCEALDDSQILFVPRDPFFALIKASPEIALKIMGALSAWLREFADKLEALSMKDVTSRLAGYLLKISKSGQVVRLSLPTSKTEIARELGTINETLSRALRKLRDSGVIDVNGKEIEILQLDRLTALAQGKKLD